MAACPRADAVPVATDREDGVRTIAYDDHVDTVLDVHPPSAPATGSTVVLVHGGFWRERYRRDLMAPLVPSLTAAGHVAVNLEYRRVGGAGGWPTTLADVAAGIDALATIGDVPTERVVTVGHSAGGHLAVWAAARHRLPDDAPGAGPVVHPVAAVSLAGVVVLVEAATAWLGDGAVDDLLAGATPARLAVADPAALLPLGVPVVCVHGVDDDTVPLSQSRSWADRARAAGDRCEVHALPGGHMDVIDPSHETWQVVLDVLTAVGTG